MDESGKGDYFGPLVIAAVLMDQSQTPQLQALRIRDSKTISDNVIRRLAQEIKALCPHAVVAIGPERYNTLYAKIKNLNRLLAWGHARAIENILEKQDCAYAISDQFGDPQWIQRALMERGKKITLEQRTKAEEDAAVAAASILARDEFVRRLEQLGQRFDMQLPKGASHVLNAAKEFVRRHGQSRLSEVAKLHFKTTAQVLKP